MKWWPPTEAKPAGQRTRVPPRPARPVQVLPRATENWARRTGRGELGAESGAGGRGRDLRDHDGQVVTELIVGKAGDQTLDHPGGLGGGPARPTRHRAG